MSVADILLSQQLLTAEQVVRLQNAAPDGRIDQLALDSGLVDEARLVDTLAEFLCLPTVDLRQITVDREAAAMLPAREIARRQILPYGFQAEKLLVAVADPFDHESLDELRLLARRPLKIALARHSELRALIKDIVGLGGGTLDEIAVKSGTEELPHEDAEQLASEASIMRLVNELISDAMSRRASDIHLEPVSQGMTIRFRIDGLLHIEPTPPEIHRFREAIVSRIKIMAKLNIAERRVPQDGRIRLKLGSGECDVRVSIIPMLHGEGVVLRLLDSRRCASSLAELEFPERIAKAFRSLIHHPHGIILVTGPTGSGKSTTLYGALADLRAPHTKIVTLEDPVEYELEGVNQIQVQPKVGLTFASGLRSILRHDPDVILLGEIRDAETASSAIQAAMTGHLVFSTLHTNDAPSSYARLVDMGIEPYLAAGSILGVLAQRLVRRLCPHCKLAYQPVEHELPADFPKPLPGPLFRADGCRQCRFSGYAGRLAIFELVASDAAVRRACMQQADIGEIYAAARRAGYAPLRQDGWSKVLAGVTSVEEVTRVTGSDVVDLQEGG
jgi:type II secretory ATPase GspE/PulE/Tfp pilus assembly ATPase PilB-like protein